MTRSLLIAWAGLAAAGFAACGVAPSELCRRSVALSCDRTFECTPAETLASMKDTVGTSAAECKVNLEGTSKCASKGWENDLCADGKTYHFDMAAACSDKVKAQSCADFLDASKTPPECAQVCT